MIMPIPHRWDLTPKEAIALQKELALQIDNTTPIDLANLQFVAGVDVSVKNNVSRAAIVVLNYPDLQVLEAVTAKQPTPFPYISGLLSFREGDVILQAHAKLQHTPDVYIFDGAGIAHPRRLGIAAHLGLWFQRPTVGCAKKRLVGEHPELPPEQGSFVPNIYKGNVVGNIVRTRTNVKPVYISPGHKATLASATELIFKTTTRYRLPEPIRAAHNMAGDF